MTTTTPTPLTFQTFLLATTLALLWGIYFFFTVREWFQVRQRVRARGDMISAFRRMLVAWCVFILPFSVTVRTALVIMGFGDAIIGQIIFFTLAGSNLIGAIFAVVSLRLD